MIKQKLLEQVIKDYLNGVSQIELGKKYPISRETIRVKLRQLNIPIRPTFKRKVDFNPFQDLTSKEVQYWLGWIVTDGNISKNRISLNSTGKDLDVLENYCKFLKIDNSNIQKTILDNPNHDLKCCVRFSNIETTNFLNNIGIGVNKSHIVNPNLEFTNDFVKGLIEGDGHIGISTNKLGYTKPVISFVTASNELVLKYRNYLSLNNVKYCIHKQNNCFITVINGKETLKLIELIYPKDNQLYCKRKFDKSKEIINYYKNKENEKNSLF